MYGRLDEGMEAIQAYQGWKYAAVKQCQATSEASGGPSALPPRRLSMHQPYEDKTIDAMHASLHLQDCSRNNGFRMKFWGSWGNVGDLGEGRNLKEGSGKFMQQ